MTDIATHEAPSTVLALSSDQTWWTERQLKALQHMGVAADVPAADLAIFLNQCQRTGLDPFAKQIYLLARLTKDGDRYVTKYTIQTGIDGYRVIGDRAAEKRGDSIEHADPLWAGADGVWTDLWTSEEPPTAAKYTIVRNGRRNVATVMHREFVQTRKDGRPNAMWTRMPANQLAKCAEVQAWRKVYPNDFAGLLMEGAALPDVEPAPQPAQRRRTTAAEILVDSGGLAADKSGERTAGNDMPPPPEPKMSTRRKKLSDTYFALMGEAGLAAPEQRGDRLIVTGALACRPVSSSNDLSYDELGAVVDEMREMRGDRLDAKITDILNEHALAEEEPPK